MAFPFQVFPESLIPQPQTGGREYQYFLPLTDFHSPIAKVLIKRTLRLKGNPSMENLEKHEERLKRKVQVALPGRFRAYGHRLHQRSCEKVGGFSNPPDS